MCQCSLPAALAVRLATAKASGVHWFCRDTWRNAKPTHQKYSTHNRNSSSIKNGMVRLEKLSRRTLEEWKDLLSWWIGSRQDCIRYCLSLANNQLTGTKCCCGGKFGCLCHAQFGRFTAKNLPRLCQDLPRKCQEMPRNVPPTKSPFWPFALRSTNGITICRRERLGASWFRYNIFPRTSTRLPEC